MLVFDAAGLGLFCVAGTEKALDHGLAPVAAARLGVTTALGGGVLRDVIARGPGPGPLGIRALRGAGGGRGLIVGIASTLDAGGPALRDGGAFSCVRGATRYTRTRGVVADPPPSREGFRS
ncbi:TRIC cation channel family protein [Geodermatophilus obscurus]|uniref:trimeric intracellular cation channel family protein n=1 Tax=Geodermatophilus obscurus TaxID=1861 RepID=UPI0009D6CB95